MATDERKTSDVAGAGSTTTASASTDTHTSANAFLSRYPLSLFELPPSGNVVVIPSDTSIADAVAILTKHNILAAPVRDVTCTHPNPAWHELYLGLFSMTDAVFAALKMEEIVSKGRLATVDEAARAAGAAVPSRGLAPDLMTVMAAQSYFMVTPVREMLSTFKFGPFVALTETDDTSVLDAALILGRYGQHRVVVVQPSTGDGSEERPLDIVREDRKLKNIITQSALVGVLARDHVIESLQPFMSRSLADLGLVQGPKKVLCADLDDDVLSACRLMVDNGLSGVGVVDGSGKLVACLSIRDVRVLVTSRRPVSILHGPVRSLIAMSRSKTNDIAHASIVAKPTDALGLVIRRMATSRIHRIFIVDAAHKPVGVVTLTDILSKMALEPRKDYFSGFFDASVSSA